MKSPGFYIIKYSTVCCTGDGATSECFSVMLFISHSFTEHAHKHVFNNGLSAWFKSFLRVKCPLEMIETFLS